MRGRYDPPEAMRGSYDPPPRYKRATMVFDLQNFLNGNLALKSTQARLDLNHRSISSLVEYCENEYRLE